MQNDLKPISALSPEEWLEMLKPKDTEFNVLSLGAGVQSSCLALMAERLEVGPLPDFAVFADTQAEPKEVYRYLDWLRTQVSYPIYQVTKGSLTKDSLVVHRAKAGHERVNNLIPAFGLLPDGSKTAAIGRKCTNDYKILPILKEIKKICEIPRGSKKITVTQWIGISWDEAQRMKESRVPWAQHRWPLIEKKMTRAMCLTWMRDNGYPEPPRSACIYCPFHSNTEWRRLRDESPIEFAAAVDFDKKLREIHAEKNKRLRMEVFIHKSCTPLGEVDLDSDTDRGQETWDFAAECEGMCGV